MLKRISMRISLMLAIPLALAAFAVHAQDADEARVKQAMQAKFPKLAVDSVTRMPFGGLFEDRKSTRLNSSH